MAWPMLTRRGAIDCVVAMPIALGASIGSDAFADDIPRAVARVALAASGGGPEVADNTPALRAAIAMLADHGGGTVDIGAGIHRFASASLGPRGIALPSNITIRGTGRNATTLRVTGTTACNVFAGVDAANLAFESLTLVGNSNTGAGSPYGIGEAIRWHMTNATTADLVGFRLTDVHLENFRGAWWVDIEHGASARPFLSMREIRIERVTFRSFAGNSAAPSLVTHNAAAIGINGFSGAIRGVRVDGLSGDATHIKSAIILYHQVVGATLDGVNVRAAGLSGATDDAGAYAIQLYDSHYRMSSITVSNPVIVAPRSVGIYVAGGSGIAIVDPRISGQTDTRAGTLPKGAIAFNGTRDWRLIGGLLRDNWRDLDIVAAPGTVGGRVAGVYADGSSNGISISCAAGHATAGIAIRNCRWRTTGRTVSVQNSSAAIAVGPPATGGRIDDIVFENCHFEADAGSRAMDLWVESGSSATGYVVSRCVLVGSNPLLARDQTGSLRIRDCTIRDLGTTAGASAATLTGCLRLELRDCILQSPGPGGVGIDLGGSTGSVRGLTFVACAHALPNAALPVQLGRAKPGFTGSKAKYVQNLEPAKGEHVAWTCVGGTTWVVAGPMVT